NDSGLYLQGWPVLPNGTFSLNPSDLNQPAPINVKNLGSAVKPTGNVAISAVLDTATVISAAETGATYNTAAASMANYAAGVAGGTQPDFTIDMSVIDSQGASHKLEMAFLKSTTPNQWDTEIYAVPATDVSTAGPSGQIATGKVAFLPD